MKINHNIASLNTYRQLSLSNDRLNSSLEKLSSGRRINRASDDAAGFAIARKMHSQLLGLNQAERNAMDAISFLQTGEGALSEIQNILQRMRELAVQAASDTLTDDNRQQIQEEVNQLCCEVNRIGVSTEFNAKLLLNGNSEASSATAIGGKSLVLPLVIHSGINDILNITVDGESIQAQLPVGTYKNAADIAEALEIAINGSTTIAQDVSVIAGEGLDKNHLLIQTTSTGKLSSIEIGSHATRDAKEVLGLIEAVEKPGYDENEGPLEMVFQIGANSNQIMEMSMFHINAKSLALTGTGAGYSSTLNVISGSATIFDEYALDYSTLNHAMNSITIIDNAISMISIERSKVGAIQNRLENTISNLGGSSLNLTAAISRIEDSDMAIEMTTYTQNNIIFQAAQAMLAQANQMPQGVLQLLR